MIDFSKTSSYAYDLPEELIAQTPLKQRDSSRLLVLNHGEIEHKHFSDILDYLEKGDCLVLNNTKVIPARLYGVKRGSGANIEVLLLKSHGDDLWETLVKPGRRVKDQTDIDFLPGRLSCKQVDILEDGKRLMKFSYQGIWQELLLEAGTMPLPPYIHEKLEDQGRYQTVYAQFDGSAAAPTAGLHFTDELLSKIHAKGIEIAELTLHVGLGTFRPVKVENIDEHIMHSEYYKIDQAACDIINKTHRDGKRVISVGTTVCRVLETLSDNDGFIEPAEGETSIFIHPGYKFKMLDGLITNFHLPESTLLMLVTAFYGYEKVMSAYKEAVEQKYRFFSFGDSMLLLP